MHPTASPDAQPSTFSSVPVLDYSLISSTSTKPLFISQLQHSLINVGFFYVSNHTVRASTIDPLLEFIPKLFALSQEEKEKIGRVNSPHFLGYSGLDSAVLTITKNNSNSGRDTRRSGGREGRCLSIGGCGDHPKLVPPASLTRGAH